MTEDATLVTDPACVANVHLVNWTGEPPSSILPTNVEQNSTTRAAAVMSHIFARDAETGGGLGVQKALMTRRLDGNDRVTIKVATFCCLDDAAKHQECDSPLTTRKTSCRHGGELLLEPDNANLSGTRFFGQYFASKVWNDDSQADCTFVYYKNFGDTACRPGVTECLPDAASGLTINRPPMPVSCVQPVRWRNPNCLGTSPTPALLASGTEFDWLEFLYGIGQGSVATSRWGMSEIFDAYVVACGTPSAPLTCRGKLVSWTGSTSAPVAASLRDASQSLATLGRVSQPAAARFRQLGDDFGISELP